MRETAALLLVFLQPTLTLTLGWGTNLVRDPASLLLVFLQFKVFLAGHVVPESAEYNNHEGNDGAHYLEG